MFILDDEFERKLNKQIKRLNLYEEPIESIDCENCGQTISKDRYASKKDNVIKLEACYFCGPGSIQPI